MFLGIYLFLNGCSIYLITIWLAVGLFGFFLVEILFPSYTWISAFFKFRKFSAIISSNILFTVFSLLPPPRAHVKQILGCLMLSLRPLILSSFLKIHFSFPSSDRGISIILSFTSHMHSSVSPNLLFISCSVFLSVIVFFSSDQFLFIFSSSFVKIFSKFSLCSSILQFTQRSYYYCFKQIISVSLAFFLSVFFP